MDTIADKSCNHSNPFLMHLVKEINKYDKLWKAYSKKISFTKVAFPNNNLSSIPDYQNYPDDIKDNIQNMSKDLYKYQMNIQNKDIAIWIIIDKKTQQSNQYADDIIYLIFLWLTMAIRHHTSSCSQTLNIYMFMTSSLKLLPSNFSGEMDRHHINSAFTYSCKKNNNIHIFREEEWFKVFIHETFHNLGFDFSGVDNGYSDVFASEIFPLNTDFRLYESYCETWATIIHSVFVYYKNEKKQNNNHICSDISAIIEKEVMFSLFQCNKILHHFGMKYEDLYMQTEGSQFARIHKYKENTPVISYYFFKTILLYNSKLFIEWCETKNDSTMVFLKNNENMASVYEKIQLYADFLKSLHKNKDLLVDMEDVRKKYTKNLSNISPNDVFYFNTLRMCLHDIM